MSIYTRVVRPALFAGDPESMHRAAIAASKWAGRLGFVRRSLASWTRVNDAALEVEVAGIRIPNPIGLAAGYDKNGEAVDGLAALGFGHLEIGSISRDASEGNPRPRLFRLPRDQAVVVHYGVPNDGVAAIAPRLRQRATSIPVGGNVVLTNRGPLAPPADEDGVLREYVDACRTVTPVVDYLTLNLSCPNAKTGCGFFREQGRTATLLAALEEAGVDVPLFVKIAPISDHAGVDRLLAEVDGVRLNGFIFNLAPGIGSGLKTPRSATAGMPGSIAGKPVSEQMNACLAEFYRRMDRSRYSLVGSGGVFTAADAYRKIRLGASMVQMLTGLIYEGPFVVKRICTQLARLLRQDGFRDVGEAVGTLPLKSGRLERAVAVGRDR